MEQFPAKIDDATIAKFMLKARVERSRAIAQAFNAAVGSVKNIFSHPAPAPRAKPHC